MKRTRTHKLAAIERRECDRMAAQARQAAGREEIIRRRRLRRLLKLNEELRRKRK